MQYTIKLTAGQKRRQEFSGKTLLLLDTGAATSLDMDLEITGFATEALRAVQRGLKLRTGGFTGASFTSAVDCTINVIATDADISVNYQDGSTVNANIMGTVPVAITGTPVPVSGTFTPLPVAAAATLQDDAAVSVGGASAAALIAAASNRIAARFTNIGTDPVTLGAAGITWAKRCIVLNSGDTWSEENAANRAWYAITDAGKSASVTVQEVLT